MDTQTAQRISITLERNEVEYLLDALDTSYAVLSRMEDLSQGDGTEGDRALEMYFLEKRIRKQVDGNLAVTPTENPYDEEA